MSEQEFDKISGKEGASEAKIRKNFKNGSLVIVRNVRRDIEPVAIGAGVTTKINANIGTSPDKCDVKTELEKARVAVDNGADAIMDLSTGGNLDEIRQTLLKSVPVPLGTVSIYQTFVEKGIHFTAEDLLKTVEKQCRQGVDFITVHCGITQNIVERLGERLIPVTSRGGGILASWMMKNEEENPWFTHFDELLGIAKEYNMCLSLGDALRPACINDATDFCQMQELLNLGKLTETARKEKVQVVIEGPGHLPMDHIEANMRLQKAICHNAPFYVLGPLVTDIGMGYDHITSAIGGAIAAMHGADFLCYVTPSEHMGLPDVKDVKDGVIASKIAAHAADIVKLRGTGIEKIDYEMSKARKELDWNRMFELCLDKELKEKHADLKDKKVCTMCGKYCALKLLDEKDKE